MRERKFKKPANPAERMCYDLLIEQGWNVTKKGWPDFFCWTPNKFMVVEVKPRDRMDLRPRQGLILRRLAKYGVPCYRWSPGDGFVRI